MFIALDGCVGAGKSTVARGLAAHRNSTVLLEQFEQNPFLPLFYENPARYATETEFMFLLLHYHQLKPLVSEMDEHELISDFHLGKDLIYAELNFGDQETLRHFNALYAFLNAQLPRPDLLIGLSASTDLIVDRIRKRNRRSELQVEPSYYGRINSGYETFFDSYPGRKMILSMDQWDFVAKPDLYENLSTMIDAELRTARAGRQQP